MYICMNIHVRISYMYKRIFSSGISCKKVNTFFTCSNIYARGICWEEAFIGKTYAYAM